MHSKQATWSVLLKCKYHWVITFDRHVSQSLCGRNISANSKRFRKLKYFSFLKIIHMWTPSSLGALCVFVCVCVCVCVCWWGGGGVNLNELLNSQWFETSWTWSYETCCVRTYNKNSLLAYPWHCAPTSDRTTSHKKNHTQSRSGGAWVS